MKFILAALVMFSSVLANADAVVHVRAYDNDYTPMYECGRNARVKAVYSKASHQLALRVCDNTLCRYPVRINTNRNFQDKQDTAVFWSPAAGIQLGGSCYEFPLNYRLQPNQRNIRAVFGTDTWLQNRARIEIELY